MESFVSHYFLFRLLICVISVVVLVKIYFHFYQHRENAVAFVLFGLGVFVVIFLLHSAQVSMGFAFGLFAIFSMLRYRTEAMGIKEMTYLFLVISVALLCAVGPSSHQALILINLLLLMAALCLEFGWIFPNYQEREIEYERIENIKPERESELYADLKERTGLAIVNVEILSINFLRDTARLRLQFKKDDHEKIK